MLKELRLINFRCYPEYHLKDLSIKNAFLGSNGKGKTSLLEAIYFLTRCRSFRTHQTRDLIHWGSTQLGVAGDFEAETVKKLKTEWSVEERLLYLNERAHISFREYWGQVHCVIFQNSDRHLLQGPAQLRRQWVDGLISSVNPDYLQFIQRAQLLLKQKNAFLKKTPLDRNLWNCLTDQLEELTKAIHLERENFTCSAAPELEEIYQLLTERKENLQIHYEAEIPRQLQRSREKLWEMENQFHAAQLGPHRDDWKFQLKDQSIRAFGSEGQVKSAALALRLLEVKMIEKKTRRWPLILIDDAVNDLDKSRQEQFWELLPKEAQLFFATPLEEHLNCGTEFQVFSI